MSNLFDTNVRVLEKSMDLLLTRQAVIADNIANAETPYFKARQVDFESALQNAVEAEQIGLGSGVAAVRPEVFQDPNSELGQDLNSVDMDREMARMTKTDIQYSAATQMISKKFGLMKYAISGGTDR